MTIGEICSREVIIAQAGDEVLEAARLMRQHHVGDVLVVETRHDIPVPVGIITDRDLVVEILASGANPAKFTVGDIMSTDLATVREDLGICESLEFMRQRGVRRLPVVDAAGGLVGIVTVDDVLALLAEELDAIVKLTRREQQKETRARS